ncbi:hypothetical protein ACIGO9_26755 [Nocardia asteroides]|uniref:hypothetical protein n=1 Tax=Nocardia asteroides TaxID=1824 RepID=UPI0037C66092
MTGTFTPYASALETLELLDRLVTESGIEPTERVAKSRAEIARIAADERALLDEIRGLPVLDPADQLEQIAERFVGRQIDAATAVEELMTAGRSTAKTRQALSNKALFRTSRAAAVELRRLGDGIIVDILRPWFARTVDDLRPNAAVVVDVGQAGVLEAMEWGAENGIGSDLGQLAELGAVGGAKAARHAAVLAATVRVETLRRVWSAADALRERGILPAVTDPTVSPLAYRWTVLTPDRLPDPAKSTRQPWFTCRALINGAGPVVRTAAEAQATDPISA